MLKPSRNQARNQQAEPLYRKVNTCTIRVRHHFGDDYKNFRNRKNNEAIKMKQGVRRGLDYTPLFMFLLAKVGQPWDKIYSEAVARLDKPEPIFWLVALYQESAKDYIVVNSNSYFSGLYVDIEGILRKKAPHLNANSLAPSCACCTHTFNGKPFTKKFVFS